MTQGHSQTNHPEWYTFAPLTHPVIAQSAFHCHRCGNLVIELPEHDTFHEGLDALLSPPVPPVHPDKITEPVKPVARAKKITE